MLSYPLNIQRTFGTFSSWQSFIKWRYLFMIWSLTNLFSQKYCTFLFPMVWLFQNSRIREVTLCPNTSLLSISLLCRTPLSSKAAVNVRLPASLLARQAAPLATWSAQNRKKQKQRELNFSLTLCTAKPPALRPGAFLVYEWTALA